MSIQTSINFYNANHPDYIAAINGTPEERKEWEEDNGPIEDRPGAMIETDRAFGKPDCVQETNDEYGGWVIDLSSIPKEATHIVIYRS